MVNFYNDSLAAIISRTTLGVVMLVHSLYLKLFVFTLTGTAAFFSSLGLPHLLAYLVFFIEVLCGFALIVGYQTQLASLLLTPILLGATWAHWRFGWLFTNQGGGWEYPLVLFFMALTQIFLGNKRIEVVHKEMQNA